MIDFRLFLSAMDDPESQTEWELSKENVQPLRNGRKFANLSIALQPNSGDQMDKLKLVIQWVLIIVFYLVLYS